MQRIWHIGYYRHMPSRLPEGGEFLTRDTHEAWWFGRLKLEAGFEVDVTRDR